jgi:hypothetical protein
MTNSAAIMAPAFTSRRDWYCGSEARPRETGNGTRNLRPRKMPNFDNAIILSSFPGAASSRAPEVAHPRSSGNTGLGTRFIQGRPNPSASGKPSFTQ